MSTKKRRAPKRWAPREKSRNYEKKLWKREKRTWQNGEKPNGITMVFENPNDLTFGTTLI
jgi:hypothetical protein